MFLVLRIAFHIAASANPTVFMGLKEKLRQQLGREPSTRELDDAREARDRKRQRKEDEKRAVEREQIRTFNMIVIVASHDSARQRIR